MHMIPNEQNDVNKKHRMTSFECTIIILQTIDTESNHIRIDMSFDPNSTALQFKSQIYEFLVTSKYSDDLQHEACYYSEIGITNEYISPHDIFQIDDDDVLMDCINPNQTIYLYHPSINNDSVLLNDYNEFYNKSNNKSNKNIESSMNIINDEDEYNELISHKMSMSYESQQSFDEDMDHKNDDNGDENTFCLQRHDAFFNSLNLHFAFIGNKYGVLQKFDVRSQLVQITHAVLVWGLRKMDNLWKLKPVQDKLQQYLKMHAFDDKEMIDIVMFGNKLNDDNALHLIKYSPWQISENKLSADTYQIMENQQNNNESLTTKAAAEPIQSEQQKAINNHAMLGSGSDEALNEPLNAALYQIKRNKRQIEEGPRRWPAQEGMLLYFCQFVFGTCTCHQFEKYMKILGKSMRLSDKSIDYILLLWKSERNLASSFWDFAELDFPLLK